MVAKLPESKHFQIERLADGVYAVIASEQGYATANAGIIDLGDKTIVFDTFISPDAAKDLLKAGEELTSHRVAYVVNSHRHDDHIRGNQVFSPHVDIISTTLTRDGIAKHEPEDIKWAKENVPQLIIETQSRLDAERDARQRRVLAYDIVYYQAIIESLPQLKTRLPNITFEHKLAIHGARRTVELHSFGPGHTASDLFLYLPEEKIAFMGDLLFINWHPYLLHGFPEEWKRFLGKVEALGVQTVIPGHGPVGRSADLSLTTQYIESLERIAVEMVKSGKPVEAVSSQPIPSPFESWGFLDFFVINLEFLYKRTAQATEKK